MSINQSSLQEALATSVHFEFDRLVKCCGQYSGGNVQGAKIGIQQILLPYITKGIFDKIIFDITKVSDKCSMDATSTQMVRQINLLVTGFKGNISAQTVMVSNHAY